MWTLIPLVFVVAADPTPIERAALDRQVSEALRLVHNQGADLYNSGDPAGCYRMLQGALLAVRPLLDHHTDVQKLITVGLADSEKLSHPKDRAFALHKVIEQARNGLKPKQVVEAKPDPQKVDPPKPLPSLTRWDRLGGNVGVGKVVADFFDLASKDPKVNLSRGGKYPADSPVLTQARQALLAFISQETNGPISQTADARKAAIAGLKEAQFTPAEFDAAVAVLRTALEKNDNKPADYEPILKVLTDLRPEVTAQATPLEPSKAEPAKPASGTSVNVTLQGQPVADATLQFVNKADFTIADGKTGPDGKLMIALKPGKYTVTVTTGGKPKLPEKYATTTTTPLTLEVTGAGTVAIDLTP